MRRGKTTVIVLAVLAALAYIGGIVAGSPSSELSNIKVDSIGNDALAQGAPQQTVAALWSLRDYAALQIQQGYTNSMRITSMLLLILVALIVLIARVGDLREGPVATSTTPGDPDGSGTPTDTAAVRPESHDEDPTPAPTSGSSPQP